MMKNIYQLWCIVDLVHLPLLRFLLLAEEIVLVLFPLVVHVQLLRVPSFPVVPLQLGRTSDTDSFKLLR